MRTHFLVWAFLPIMGVGGMGWTRDTAVAGVPSAGIAESYPLAGISSAGRPETDEMWDLLFSSNAQGACGSQTLLGAAFAGGHFWIVGGGSSASPSDNMIYMLSPTGVLVDSFPQPNVGSGWGFRDLAFDGTYLYGGCEASVICAFDTNGTMVPTMNVPKPPGAAVIRALTYDPVTDHFWSGNFGDNIFEFTRSGVIVSVGSPSPWIVHAMAWDDVDPLGPWLWVLDGGMTFRQFAPETHVFTGVSHTLPLLPGLISQSPAGCEMNWGWSPIYVTMTGLAQGLPNSVLYVLEMYFIEQPPDYFSLTPINPPIVIPANGGSFAFNVTLQNPESNPLCVDVWTKALLPTGLWLGPILGPVNVYLPPAAMITKTRIQMVPGNAPAGVYAYWGYLGDYPSSIWDGDSFAFEKLATGDGMRESGWMNYGENFETEHAPIVQSSEFELTQTYPNPFNPMTTISFALPEAMKVMLSVYDISGRQVATLVNGWREAGNHEVVFDGSELASGVYVYRLSAGDFSTSGKLLLMK